MKLLGAILIIAASIILAVEYRSRMKMRVKQLEGICSMILRLSAEIRRNRPPLESLMRRAGPPEAFAAECNNLIRCGADFQSAWLYAADHTLSIQRLQHTERERLCELGNRLGRGDVEAELRLLDEYYEFYAQQRQSAALEFESRSKVAVSCYVLCGMLLAVVLV